MSENVAHSILEVELGIEGSTYFYHPKIRSKIPRASDVVFYNPKQEFNRTLSILTLKALFDSTDNLDPKVKVCEPLSATGIRGLRYLNEVEAVSHVCLNDLNPRAVELIKRNIELLKEKNPRLSTTRKKATIDQRDAIRHLHAHHVRYEYFDVVDVDPYGTPAPYLEAATLVLDKGGVLAATATDMPVLVGNYPAVAFENLGISLSFKPWFHHEFALRSFVLGLMWPGFKHEMFFKPVLAFYKDHYVRSFVQRVKGKETMRKNVGFMGICASCFVVKEYRPYWHREPMTGEQCPACGNPLKVIGPCWLGELQAPQVLERILTSEWLNEHPKSEKMLRFLTILQQENEIDIPFHHDVHLLCRSWKISALSTQVVLDVLHEHGYEAVRAHYRGTAFKTDAPSSELRSLLSSLK